MAVAWASFLLLQVLIVSYVDSFMARPRLWADLVSGLKAYTIRLARFIPVLLTGCDLSAGQWTLRTR